MRPEVDANRKLPYFHVIFRTLEAASSKYLEKEAAYIADIKNLEDKLSDVSRIFSELICILIASDLYR